MQPPLIDSADLFRLVHFFDVLAAIVFAVSGALVASRKGMDVMGFIWLAVVTGVGGGTVRDLILGVPVFWVQNPVHVSACLVTAVVMHFIAPLVESRYTMLLWFDAFGLALVTIAGTVKALDVGCACARRHRHGCGDGLVWRNHPRHAWPRAVDPAEARDLRNCLSAWSMRLRGPECLRTTASASDDRRLRRDLWRTGLAIKFGWSLPVFRESVTRGRWKTSGLG